MEMFSRCDMCVGECSTCENGEVPYRVGKLYGKREAYNDLIDELSKELDNLTLQKVSKIEIISSVIKKIRDKEKAL